MGKNKNFEIEKGKKVTVDDLLNQIAELQDQVKILKGTCSHQGASGKAKTKFINKLTGDVRCKLCGTEFNIAMVPENVANDAIYVVHNMLNQIIVFADPKVDAGLVKILGQVDANLLTLMNSYSKRVLKAGKGDKKKNKKNKNNNGHGGIYIKSFAG